MTLPRDQHSLCARRSTKVIVTHLTSPSRIRVPNHIRQPKPVDAVGETMPTSRRTGESISVGKRFRIGRQLGLARVQEFHYREYTSMIVSGLL
jgi:hypothetical protein